MIGSVRASDRAATVIAVLAVCTLVVAPVAKLVQVAAERGGRSLLRVMASPGLGEAALHSIVLACVVPLLAAVLGSAMALLLRRTDLPCRTLLRVMALLPLLIPQFVLGYSWTQAYGRAGFTDGLIGLHWAGIEGPIGIVVVLVVDLAPLSFVLTTVGLATRAQPQLEHAARLSGAKPATVLRTITLPLLWPVLAAELALTFVAALESFAVPQVLGTPAGFSTLTTRIYADLALGSAPASFTDAVTVALGLVLVAALVLLPADVILAPRLLAARTAQPGAAEVTSGRSRSARMQAAVLAAYGVVAVGLPAAALVSAALVKAPGLAPTPANWTLDNFRAALGGPNLAALSNSLRLAVAAAFALTALGALVTALERRRSGRLLGTATIVPFALPGSALAVGLLICYGRRLGDGLALILVAYLAKFWAVAHRAVSGAADRVPREEAEAARTSGAGPATAVATVWLPALAPALLGAWLLVFLSSLHELTMSSLLYSVANQTLAVAVLNSQELGDVGQTAALSVLLTAVVLAALIPIWTFQRLIARRRTGARQLLAVAPELVPEAPGAR